MKISSQKIIDLKKEYMIPCSYHFYKDPPVLVKGDMQYLFDVENKRYTDFFTGVTVMNCGHCNEEITSAAIKQIRELQHTTTIYLTEPIVRLAEALVNFLDCSLKKVFFVNSGSEANEGAVLLSRIYTGKTGLIALNGGLHGRTALTMSLTGIPMWRTLPENQLEKVHFAPTPHCANCELSKTFPSCDYACVKAVEDILESDNNIAAMIAEPVQGNGGIIVPPEGYFERVKKVLEKFGVLLILDEVQTGMGRTGTKYAFMSSGIEPDILTTAKALGNGFPIAAFCTTDKIASVYTKPGASTTGGNAVSATSALAVIDYFERNNLPENSARLGKYLIDKLRVISEKYSFISEIRGKGLMIGMEIGKAENPLCSETDFILEGMKDRGFLIGKSGVNRNVIAFLPPLIITENNIDEMVTALSEVLENVLGKQN